ncbi:MAG: hypothetical protein HFG64_05400 [Lachnospiraceae bacterium]|nr:hypothetical protein [Lachnospiraceae bacterium]
MEGNQEHDIRLTEFDYMLVTPQLQMLKAAIPHIPPSWQRMLSVFVKFQELQHVQNIFSQGELSAMGLSTDQQRPSSPMELIQAIKPYAGPREREMIETLENIQLMIQTMQPLAR